MSTPSLEISEGEKPVWVARAKVLGETKMQTVSLPVLHSSQGVLEHQAPRLYKHSGGERGPVAVFQQQAEAP